MTKEEKIKEVYGLQFQKVQFDICTDGWVHTGHFYKFKFNLFILIGMVLTAVLSKLGFRSSI